VLRGDNCQVLAFANGELSKDRLSRLKLLMNNMLDIYEKVASFITSPRDGLSSILLGCLVMGSTMNWVCILFT
jgi:hypothetical protein